MQITKQKVKAIVAFLIVILFAVVVITVFYLVSSQKKLARERKLYNAAREKENEGDNYFYIQNDFVRAEESYLEAENLVRKLGDDFSDIKRTLKEKLASEEIKKYKEGYVLFEGRWVKPSEMTVQEKIRLEKMEQRRREIEEDLRRKREGAQQEEQSAVGEGGEYPVESVQEESGVIEE